MVTRQQSTTNTPVHTRAYVSRAGETPSVIRAARLHRGLQAGTGHLARARRRIAVAALVNIDNRCKQRELQRTYCSDPPHVAQLHLLGSSTQHCASTPRRLQKNCIATDKSQCHDPMLVLLLLHAAAARIRGVQVLAVGTKPELGGPLNTQAAQKAQNKDVTYIKKKKPRKALAHDAARWFGSRGYVVDDVGVNTQTVGDDELVVLSARVLPCGPIRLRAANGTHVRTKPATVARALGLRKGQPFRWDPTRLAALIREDGGLFRAEATRARASVEDGVVALDLTVAEPWRSRRTARSRPSSMSTRTGRGPSCACRTATFGHGLRRGGRGFVYTEGGARARGLTVTPRVESEGWSARLKPLGLKSLSTQFDGRRAWWTSKRSTARCAARSDFRAPGASSWASGRAGGPSAGSAWP